MPIKKPYSLFAGSRNDDAALIEFSSYTRRYKHTIRTTGGYWIASWIIPLQGDLSSQYLTSWYKDRLGHLITERVGGMVTWKGVVWSMELTLDGWKERKDLGEVWNAIKAIYTNEAGDTTETSWYTNETSINRYGRREFIIPLDNVTSVTAETRAQTMLSETSDPWSRPVDYGRDLADMIEIHAVGEVFTANNKYVTVGDGTPDNVSTFIQEIVTTDCEFLSIGRLTENTTQVRKSFRTPIRAWDALLHLTEIGDGTTPFTISVDSNSLVHYRPVDPTPAYHWNGKNGGMTRLGGDAIAWAMQPGVVRNITRPKTTPIPGSFLTDGRDTWTNEIEMSDGASTPTLKPDGYDDASIERAAEQARKWLESEAEE